MSFEFPSVKETLEHPAYASAVWSLEPHQKGKFQVAKGRGGPFGIDWEIHGSGPTKLVLVMGLGAVKAAWQRQTNYFGHRHADKYSVFVFDNRGMGDSDKPVARYTTSAMAADLAELLEHVGWASEPRGVHIVGISLGGMIAQELACAMPSRLRSLSLLCTTASFEGRPSSGLADALAQRAGFVVPKSEERAIADTARKVFGREWLAAPDDAEAFLPDPATDPRCGSGGGGGGFVPFKNNFQRWQAQELAKKRAPGVFTTRGFLCQLMAAAGHSKTPRQLRDMADKVGRERIMVLHGREDEMIVVQNGEKLIKYIEPGVGLIVDGMGHGPPLERTAWFNELLEERMAAWDKLE